MKGFVNQMLKGSLVLKHRPKITGTYKTYDQRHMAAKQCNFWIIDVEDKKVLFFFL
jgi:hypothetical protein